MRQNLLTRLVFWAGLLVLLCGCRSVAEYEVSEHFEGPVLILRTSKSGYPDSEGGIDDSGLRIEKGQPFSHTKVRLRRARSRATVEAIDLKGVAYAEPNGCEMSGIRFFVGRRGAKADFESLIETARGMLCR